MKGEENMKIENGKYYDYLWDISNPDKKVFPIKKKKPSIFKVTDIFSSNYSLATIRNIRGIISNSSHIYLISSNGLDSFPEPERSNFLNLNNIYFSLTVCNQSDLYKKLPSFMRLKAKKYLEIFMTGEVNLPYENENKQIGIIDNNNLDQYPICGVVLRTESCFGNSIYPDWVRDVRDVCSITKTPFFFCGWTGGVS